MIGRVHAHQSSTFVSFLRLLKLYTKRKNDVQVSEMCCSYKTEGVSFSQLFDTKIKNEARVKKNVLYWFTLRII